MVHLCQNQHMKHTASTEGTHFTSGGCISHPRWLSRLSRNLVVAFSTCSWSSLRSLKQDASSWTLDRSLKLLGMDTERIRQSCPPLGVLNKIHSPWKVGDQSSFWHFYSHVSHVVDFLRTKQFWLHASCCWCSCRARSSEPWLFREASRARAVCSWLWQKGALTSIFFAENEAIFRYCWKTRPYKPYNFGPRLKKQHFWIIWRCEERLYCPETEAEWGHLICLVWSSLVQGLLGWHIYSLII